MQDTLEMRVPSWSGRSPGEGNGSPLQYSCLENSVDRGAWRATVHGVTNSHWGELEEEGRLGRDVGCIFQNCILYSSPKLVLGH